MNVGKRHRQGLTRGRALFASMSVIALLALACFPVFAHAECVSSSCVQYTEAIPKAEGEHTSSPSPHQKTPAKSSSTDNGGAAAPKPHEAEGSEGSEGSEETESSSHGGGVAGNGNGGGTGQGKPAGSGGGKGQSPVQQANQPKGTSTSQSSDNGSSPLVPILIGIAVLAAISVGAVMYRQRRQRRGPTASAPSPKAS
jgi:cobalamin biosynthesis Mg chelatase CobN